MKTKVNNKGITLIALVITIIVLLILAGVTINMLSGENGILRQAAKAKTDTEMAQEEEADKLLEYEVQLDFTAEGKQNPISFGGMIVKKGTDADTLKDKLPVGYKIYNSTSDNDITTGNLTTGMRIKKGDSTVARIILPGDVDGDGTTCSLSDYMMLYNYLNKFSELEWYQKIAANINNDTELSPHDLIEMDKNSYETSIEQNSIEISINKDSRNLKRNYSVLQQYIKSIDSNSPYKFYYNEENDIYTLKGVEEGITTVGELKTYLGDDVVIKKAIKELTDEDVITKGYNVYKKIIITEDYQEVNPDTGETETGTVEVYNNYIGVAKIEF